MILQKILLNPFAGIKNRSIEFDKGLNVILGPNEAGKSTVFNALLSVLFTPAKLNKRSFDTDMKSFIPLGGDTAGVELEIIHNGKLFTLIKTWGETIEAVLKLEGGEILTGEDAIEEKLARMLPAGEGTFKSVLLTRQSGLSQTLTDLRDDYPETIQNMGDILRRSLLETDGVPLDKLRELIEERYNEKFSRWDRDEAYPENGRGIHNPYQKELGLISQAFYKKEQVKLDLEEALRYESELDGKNKQVHKAADEIEKFRIYVEKNKSIITDARESRGLTSELKLLNKELSECKKALKEWPVLESDLEKSKKELPDLSQNIKELIEEENTAKLLEKNKELRDKFERVKKLKAALDKKKEKMDSTPVLNEDELDKIIAANQDVEKINAGLMAGELALKFTAKKETSINVQQDFSNKKQQKLNKDQVIQLKASRRITMSHPDWEMEIESSSSGFKKIEESLNNANTKLKNLLDKKKVTSLTEAKKLHKVYADIKNDFQNAQKNIKTELDKDSFEKLELEIKKLGNIKCERPLVDVAKERVMGEVKKKELNENITQITRKIDDYVNAYETLDQLMEEELAGITGRKKQLEKKLNKLKPLPDNISDLDAFVEEFKKAEKDLEDNREYKNDLLREISGIISMMPESTAEELLVDLRDKETAFKLQLGRGEAINRIRELSEEMMDQMDSSTYEGLEKKLASYISLITEKRYKSVNVENGLPGDIIRDNGTVLTYNLLSDGTRDVVALALRLCMGEFFLGDAPGFLAMDDPLVDLDPVRREKAVEVLQKFASQRQLLFFTCHPEHAKMLGGNVIEIGARV